MLLESGQDVDKKDQVLVFPGLCKSNVCGFLHSFLALVDNHAHALVFGLQARACTKPLSTVRFAFMKKHSILIDW